MPTCYRHPGRETYIKCQRCERVICPDCMRDAAVGFQCPECIAEGAKSTRSGRTPYGGLRSGNPQLTSLVLIAMNAGVWLLILASGAGASRWLDRFAMLSTGRCDPTQLAGYYPGIGEAACNVSGPAYTWVPGLADGAWWLPVTSMFTHVEIWHIAFNMLALWVLGPQMEAVVGRWRLLALYFISGYAGSVCVYWLSGDQVQTVGASGAIFGLMGGLLLVAIKIRGNVQGILVWIGINIAITVVGAGSISWQGHTGGLVSGALIGAIFVYAPKQHRLAWQIGGLVALTLALVALTVARTTQLA